MGTLQICFYAKRQNFPQMAGPFFCLAMGSLYLMDGKDNSKAAVPPGAGMHWYLF